MSDLSGVNSQITDAVTQTNVKVLGEAPAEALAIATQALAHSVSLAMENSSQTQGGMQQINNTATSALIAQITQIKPAAI